MDACGLLTREEIKTVQGSGITDTAKSENSDQYFHASHCYFTAEQSNRSVSLSVTHSAGTAESVERLEKY